MMPGFYPPVTRTVLGSLVSRATDGDKLSKKAMNYLKGKGEGVGRMCFEFALERTRIYDDFVEKYVRAYPNATILNVGAGFCTRFWRVDNGHIKWIDMDFKSIGNMRKDCFVDDFTDRQSFVIHDLSLPDMPKDLPDYDLVIAEGVMMYLKEKAACNFVMRQKHIIFDAIGKNRTLQMGSNQLWKYDPERWCLPNVIQTWAYDQGKGQHGNRDAICIEARHDG